MYSQELSANKNGVQVLESSGYYVIDKAWVRAYNAKEPYLELPYRIYRF